MPLKVTISERAEKNLDELVGYLEKEFSEKVKQRFLQKLIKIIRQISTHPFSSSLLPLRKKSEEVSSANRQLFTIGLQKMRLKLLRFKIHEETPIPYICKNFSDVRH